MTRFIALLRGINVGGNNKISMKELKAAFERHGFSEVVTYINSGNILFNSDMDLQTVKTSCEKIIETEFKLNILVCIITAADLIEALNHVPDWWNNDKESKHNAIFVIPPATTQTVCASVGEAKPEYENIAWHGNVIFWSAPIKTFSKTRWSKIVNDRDIFNLITIRNANTTHKLAQLAKEK